jgi:biotin carboxylase
LNILLLGYYKYNIKNKSLKIVLFSRNNKSMKKILILGAGEYQVPLITTARNRGLFTIVVSPEGNYPGFSFADKKYYFDLREKEKILRLAEKENIDGIATDQTDIPIKTQAYVSEKLGLSGFDYKAALLFTNKYLMREKCKEIGLDTVNYRLIKNINEAKKTIEDIGCPLVIKPVDNQGSRGVYKIRTEQEMEKYLPYILKLSSDKTALIEQLIEGPELVLESLVINKKIKNLIIGDTYYFNYKNKFIPKQRLFPSNFNKEIKKKVIDIDKKIIRAFGLKNGLTHSEYIMDEKNKKIYLLEIGARGGGANISSHIIPALTNLDVNNFILDNSLGINNKFILNKKYNTAAGYISFYLPKGIISELSGLEEIDNFPNILKHNLSGLKIGMHTKGLEDKSSRKIIIITSNSRNGLLNIIEEVKNIINIKITTKRGQKNIIWD